MPPPRRRSNTKRGPGFGGGAISLVAGSGRVLTPYYGTTASLPFSTGGTCLAPAESVTGDQLVMLIFGSNNNTPVGTPAGWTLRISQAYVSSGWAALYTRTAAGDGAANNTELGADSPGNRIIAQMIAIHNAIAINEFDLGYSNKAGYTRVGNSLTFPLVAHTAGLLVVFAGAVLGTDMPPSDYSLGTEVIDFFTPDGNDYNLTAGDGATDGSAIDPFTITNAGSTNHVFAGYVAIS